MNKQQITELINSKIIDNDNGQITAEVMRNVLNVINDYEPAVADELGDGEDAISQKAVTEAIRKLSAALNSLEYTYISTATPSTTPVTLKGNDKVFYIATEEGDYSNFGLAESISDFSIIQSLNERWVVESLGIPFMLQKKLSEQNQLNKSVNEAIASLQKQIDTLTGVDTSEAIENLNEIITFFTGINDTETLKGLLAALELSLKNEIAKHLPLAGGTMLGDIDMNGNRIGNIGLEEVDALPTFNLYEGRMVRFKNKTYTFYNSLWLALSDDLRGRANDTHEENFVYQPTAADLSIKDGFADIKRIKGNTVVWNQKVADYNTYNSRYMVSDASVEYNNGTFILRGSGSSITFRYKTESARPQHKLFIKFEVKTSESIRYSNIHIDTVTNQIMGSVEDAGYISTNAENYSTFKKIYTTAIFNSAYGDFIRGYGFGIYIPNYTGSDVYLKNIQIFDITQMFGEGNEPSTVEEFEAMFPNEYYEYNEGELLSFDGKGLKSVGFNAFDGEQAKVLKGQKYYLGGTYTALGFKENENSETIAFELPSDRYYTPTSNGYIVAAGENICINLSHSGYRNGEYEPYEDYKLSFQDGKTISQLTGKLNGEGDSVVIFPEGLRSAGEAFDEIVYDEATNKHKAIKRIGSVDMGNLNWMYQEKLTRFSAQVESAVETYNANLITPLYTTNRSPVSGSGIDKTIYAAEGYIFVNTFSDTDPASFKASLQGQILYYELAEPEVYELDNPINMSYGAYDFGTEEVLYSNDSEVNIPMKASIEYGFNAVDMIRNNFEEIISLKERVTALEQAILQIQAANTSTETPIEP